jgi:NTP pyrophosphatase (non-canonical NTP hydrolase)
MPMSNNGLTKLVEECGELVQIAAKAIAYPDIGGLHPDQMELDIPSAIDITQHRLEDEMADVLAASQFVIRKLRLDQGAINERMAMKLQRFTTWDKEI